MSSSTRRRAFRAPAGGGSPVAVAFLVLLATGSVRAAPAARPGGAAARSGAPAAAAVGVPSTGAYAPADSAAAAREAIRAGRLAIAAGDSAAALAACVRAHTIFPEQWLYTASMAVLAVARGDTALTARALDDLAALGAAPDLGNIPRFRALMPDPRVQAAMARLDSLRIPLVASTPAATIPDSLFYPEGVAWDSVGGEFLVASIHRRKVTAVRPGGASRDVVQPAQDSLFAAMGVRVDAKRRLLWVTSAALPQMEGYTAADSGRGFVHAFDLRTGVLRSRHELPRAAEGHIPGDLVLASNGDAYISDTAHPVVYRVRGGAAPGAVLEEFLTSPDFRWLQGLAFSADERTLFVADYSHGLAAVELATRTVRWLRPPPGTTVLGIDGLVRHGRDLIAVQNGLSPPRIVRLRLAGGGRGVPDAGPWRIEALEVLDRNLLVADEPTIGTVIGDDFVYVANSLWEKHDDAGRPRPGVVLPEPVLLRLPLGMPRH